VVDAIKYWVCLMVLLSALIFAAKSTAVICFNAVGNNIVAGVRKELYEAVMRKDVGWHDDRLNSSGVITATLASDVQQLTGASSEGTASIVEATAAFVWGLVLAFIFSWPIAVIGLVAGPILCIGSYLQEKSNNDMYFESSVEAEVENKNSKSNQLRQADLLVSDLILNYKTVASFGNDNVVIGEYAELLRAKT